VPIKTSSGEVIETEGFKELLKLELVKKPKYLAKIEKTNTKIQKPTKNLLKKDDLID
jgi:hypothetical protein